MDHLTWESVYSFYDVPRSFSAGWVRIAQISPNRKWRSIPTDTSLEEVLTFSFLPWMLSDRNLLQMFQETYSAL